MRFPFVLRSRLEEIRIRHKFEILQVYGEKARVTEQLQKEVDFWRGLWEKEQVRADRAVDSAMEAAGREPLSAVVRNERVTQSEASEHMEEQVKEIFTEVAASLTGQDEPVLEPEPEVEETAEENRARRLAVLRKSNQGEKAC